MLFFMESALVCVCFLVFVLYGVQLKSKRDTGYLLQENMIPIRGLLSVCIVLHHGSGAFAGISFLAPFRYIGYLIVALFFFLSGYGLTYGLNTKKGYMNNFLKKRLTSILIPYWCANVLYFCGILLLGEKIALKDLICSMFLIKIINGPTWYVQCLVFFYLIFYFSFFKGKENVNYLIFGLIFFIAYIGVFALGVDDLYTRSSLAFPLGMIWFLYKQCIDRAMEEHRKIFSLTAITVMILGFSSKIIGEIEGMEILFQIGNNSSAISFCVTAK